MRGIKLHSQIEFLVPFRVQLLWHRFRPLLRLPDLDGGVWVRSAGLILGYQTLGAYHCGEDELVMNQFSSLEKDVCV